MISPRFIVYGLVDPRTGATRYIGKSSSGMTRPKSHMYASKLNNDKTYKGNWLRELQSQGLTYQVELLDIATDANDLVEKEMYWIREARLNGWPLTNLTDGGEGVNGLVFSDSHKRKIADASAQHRHSEETKRLLSEQAKQRAKHPTENMRLGWERASKKLRGRPCSEYMRRRTSETHKGKVQPERVRRLIGAANSRAVRETITGRVYPSAAAAAREFCVGVDSVNKIVCGVHKKTVGGLHFERV